MRSAAAPQGTEPIAMKLTEAEWTEVEKRSEKYLPRKSS
jgi:hypothetical protein